MGAHKGNRNAAKGKHGRKLIGVSGEVLDLIYDVLASEGTPNPSSGDVKRAVYTAIRIVYAEESSKKT